MLREKSHMTLLDNPISVRSVDYNCNLCYSDQNYLILCFECVPQNPYVGNNPDETVPRNGNRRRWWHHEDSSLVSTGMLGLLVWGSYCKDGLLEKGRLGPRPLAYVNTLSFCLYHGWCSKKTVPDMGLLFPASRSVGTKSLTF